MPESRLSEGDCFVGTGCLPLKELTIHSASIVLLWQLCMVSWPGCIGPANAFLKSTSNNSIACMMFVQTSVCFRLGSIRLTAFATSLVGRVQFLLHPFQGKLECPLTFSASFNFKPPEIFPHNIQATAYHITAKRARS